MPLAPRPFNSFILCAPVKEQGLGRSSLIILGREVAFGQFKEFERVKPTTARVLRLPDHFAPDYWLKPEDIIFIPKGAGTEVTVDGTDYLLIHEDIILGAE